MLTVIWELRAHIQARFCAGAGGNYHPNLSLAPQIFGYIAAVCSSKTSKQLYRGGGVFWRLEWLIW